MGWDDFSSCPDARQFKEELWQQVEHQLPVCKHSKDI
jgi:hypothetical protein